LREKTEHEAFWEGSFGDAYTQRNAGDPAARSAGFQKILSRTNGVRSICEFGANRGLNLRTLHALDPSLALSGIEINGSAIEELRRDASYVTVFPSAIQDFTPSEQFDMTFTSGVLIHVNPTDLPIAYERLYTASRRYVLIMEYFNPVPVELAYRGETGRLFKRDFAGEFIDHIGASAVHVVDYGFFWRRVDPGWDDITWVLFERTR
jgi:pseudaminic acid biosynthesis-associated methylase